MSAPTQQAVLTFAEGWAEEEGKHLGACLVQAGKAWKAWKKRGGYPHEWETALKERWLSDEQLHATTEKAKWNGYQ